MPANYQLSQAAVGPTLLVHDDSTLPAWLGDYDEGPGREFTLADALAASGDYFVTLATRLDKLAQGMPRDSAEQIELEHLVKTLLYLQDYYDIVAKYKRQ